MPTARGKRVGTVVPLFMIGFVIWGWSGWSSDILEGDF